MSETTAFVFSKELFKVIQEYIEVPDYVTRMTLVLDVDGPAMVTFTAIATPAKKKGQLR